MTISGSLEALSEAEPLILIRDPEPGPPSPGVTSRPATFPLSMSWVFITAPLFISSAFIADMEPVMSSFLTVPYPMTTISSRYSVSSFSVTVEGSAAASNTCEAYPMQLISTIAEGPVTVRE